MFTSCFGVCMCEVYVSILYILFPTSALGALGVLIMTVSSCTDTHGRARTHQMLQWCVCDAANDSSRAAVWGHMLSLITTERSGLALINSTDVTISIPLHKDSTVPREKCSCLHPTLHKPGISWCQPGQYRGAAGKEKCFYCHCSLGRNVDVYCWASVMNIVIGSSRRKHHQIWIVREWWELLLGR